MKTLNTQDFLALSSFLNYQLSGEPINWQGVLSLMVKEKLKLVSSDVLLEALQYIDAAYRGQKRRLGPLAILHLIRTAAILAMAVQKPSTLCLLIALLHDNNEDIIKKRYNTEEWNKINDRYLHLNENINAQDRKKLNEAIKFLTREKGVTYHHYLGRLIKQSSQIPVLIRVKLADRLDNTLDLRIDLHSNTDTVDCNKVIFEALFVQSYKGLRLEGPHSSVRKINGAMRLYQLYKNAVFLSVLRDEKVVLDKPSRELFSSLASASISEAQTIMLHIFAYHIKKPSVQRSLLKDVIAYSESGGLQQINLTGPHSLDGLFKNRFEHSNTKRRNECLAELYKDKKLMGQTAVAFIVLFANFINNPKFTIKGITAEGISPHVAK